MSSEEQTVATEEAPRAEKRALKETDENDEVVAAKSAKIENGKVRNTADGYYRRD